MRSNIKPGDSSRPAVLVTFEGADPTAIGKAAAAYPQHALEESRKLTAQLLRMALRDAK